MRKGMFFLWQGPQMPKEVHNALTPAKVRQLQRRYNRQVHGDELYWHAKRNSRVASFVTLDQVMPVDVGPKMAPSRGPAWFVLEDHADPIVSVPEMLQPDGGRTLRDLP